MRHQGAKYIILLQSEGVKGSEGKIAKFGGWSINLSMRGISLRFTLHYPSLHHLIIFQHILVILKSAESI